MSLKSRIDRLERQGAAEAGKLVLVTADLSGAPSSTSRGRRGVLELRPEPPADPLDSPLATLTPAQRARIRAGDRIVLTRIYRVEADANGTS